MRVLTMMLCEHATLSDRGLVSVLNGGVNQIPRATFPAQLGLTLVAIVEHDPDYVDGTRIDLDFTVTSADDTETFARAEGFLTHVLKEGADPAIRTTPVVLDMSGVPLTRAGIYRVNASLGGERAMSIPFQVVHGATLDQPSEVPS
ncbi:hypothetical protein A5690_17325 [Mycobacterium intracellulare]|uniref:DUF6941 family protein n=1 Tax=Mycobacterium intracellulare TaxID=1767 RepID=UPI0007EB6FFD|nr:hypothetical protein [Mycobacterium intracellulare]OBH46242.1 hypothetical protein A5690_17325 [Mycobacterium intracellulare]